jgi:hypothetical protein
VSEGTAARALAWGLAVAGTLAAWPWLLAWSVRRWPALLAGMPHPTGGPGSLAAGSRAWPDAGVLAAWLALVTVAAMLPADRGLLTSDADAGVLWLPALALATLPWRARPRAADTSGALLALAACVLPALLLSSSLDLADVVIAQQGGLGNWFLLRDPFLLLAAALYLLTVASLWPAVPARPEGLEGWLAAAVAAGLPLVLLHVWVVVFAGGWWAFVPLLDGPGLLHTASKVVLVLLAVAALRRHLAWPGPRVLRWLLPVAAMACAAGSALWGLATGALW